MVPQLTDWEVIEKRRRQFSPHLHWNLILRNTPCLTIFKLQFFLTFSPDNFCPIIFYLKLDSPQHSLPDNFQTAIFFWHFLKKKSPHNYFCPIIFYLKINSPQHALPDNFRTALFFLSEIISSKNFPHNNLSSGKRSYLSYREKYLSLFPNLTPSYLDSLSLSSSFLFPCGGENWGKQRLLYSGTKWDTCLLSVSTKFQKYLQQFKKFSGWGTFAVVYIF